MFIKTTINSAGQAYCHLVESYRLDGKVKHRTLLSLGKAGEDRMDELIAALSKHKEILTILELAKSIEVKDTYYEVLCLPWLPPALCDRGPNSKFLNIGKSGSTQRWLLKILVFISCIAHWTCWQHIKMKLRKSCFGVTAIY